MGDDESTFVSLDPADWSTHRRVAREALDLMLDYQEKIADQPVWRPMPPEKEARLQAPLPAEGEGIVAAFREFRETVSPYVLGNPHPRFWGWVPGQGTPGGIIAELLAAGVNAVTGPFNDSSARVEAQVIDWLREAMGMPEETGGVLTSGGSMANLIGLAVGRDAVAVADVPRDGLVAEGRRLAVYASGAVHSSVKKSLQILGMGRSALRTVPVDDDYRIRVDVLEEMLTKDLREGTDVSPAILVGSAGTVDTGAFDDFEALADLADRAGLWLHIDGAFGALAALAPDLRPLVAGMERADSLAFDAHKWMSAPYDVGVVLVRDREAHRKTFTVEASYLSALPRGTGARPESTDHLSPQLSRGFRALSVWMSIREHGMRHFGRVVQEGVDQARYLAGLVREHPDLELMAPVPLCIVCFRYTVPGLAPPEEDALNREILMRLQEQGIAVPSSTVIDGRFVLRVANTNHRTRREDFDRLVEETVRLGEEIKRERRATATTEEGRP
jgi:glutamate/tyrosine decarboxylase-like PLP-dependent enzyme